MRDETSHLWSENAVSKNKPAATLFEKKSPVIRLIPEKLFQKQPKKLWFLLLFALESYT